MKCKDCGCKMKRVFRDLRVTSYVCACKQYCAIDHATASVCWWPAMTLDGAVPHMGAICDELRRLEA